MVCIIGHAIRSFALNVFFCLLYEDFLKTCESFFFIRNVIVSCSGTFGLCFSFSSVYHTLLRFAVLCTSYMGYIQMHWKSSRNRLLTRLSKKTHTLYNAPNCRLRTTSHDSEENTNSYYFSLWKLNNYSLWQNNKWVNG